MIKYLIFPFILFSYQSFAQEEAEAVKIVCKTDEYYTDKWSNFRQNALRVIDETNAEQTANFEVTYIDVPQNAKLSTQAAVDIWSKLISSKMPIRVLVNWVSLGERTLGTAGSTKIYRNALGLPIQNTWYVAPLAESLLEKELNSGDIDIEIKVNSAIRWHFGIGEIKFNEFDLTTVILHEIAHALGISSSFDISDDSKKGYWGGLQASTSKGYYVYDYFIENSDKQQLVNEKIFANNSSDLKSQLTSNQLYFSLKKGQMAGDKIKIHAPFVFAKGSSISHFDENLYSFGLQNSLLTPNVSPTEINREPGFFLLNCLQNLGWQVALTNKKLVVQEITAFPNPIIDELSVQFTYMPIKRSVKVDLITNMGITIDSQIIVDYAPTIYFKFSNFPSGFYFLKIFDNEQISYKRIFKP